MLVTDSPRGEVALDCQKIYPNGGSILCGSGSIQEDGVTYGEQDADGDKGLVSCLHGVLLASPDAVESCSPDAVPSLVCNGQVDCSWAI